MLSKVFKYDIRSLRNTILTMLVVLLSLGLVGFGVRMWILRTEADGSFFPNLGLYGLWILTMIGIVTVAVAGGILILYRYYKSVFTDEGYLTMTLPVGTHALLLGKMFAAFLYALALAVAAGVAYTIAVTIPTVLEMIEQGYLQDFWQYFSGMDILGSLWEDVPTAVFGIVNAFFTAVREFVLLYAAVTFGATAMKKAKLVGVVLFVFLISFVNSILSTLLALLTSMVESMILTYSVDILLSAIVILIFYYLTYHLLHRNFNIE